MDAMNADNVQTILGHQFKDRSLLLEALHTAGAVFRFAGGRVDPDGNKRLALLGDTVLKLALLDLWYHGGSSRGTAKLSTLFHGSYIDL